MSYELRVLLEAHGSMLVALICKSSYELLAASYEFFARGSWLYARSFNL